MKLSTMRAERYVDGQVHTNGLENFWSVFKRNLRGTYVSVEPFHLDRYLDEQVFRYNNRATKDNPLNDSDRSTLLMSQVAGRRLTYAQLTGKNADALHQRDGRDGARGTVLASVTAGCFVGR
jgi:ISXO2-like transposase domain